MIGLLQRVSQASVSIEQQCVASIGTGLLVLVGVEKHDDNASASKLLNKILGYRVFSDTHGRMNHSLQDIRGELLLVPQFTLAADTRKGLRPSFSNAAPPTQGEALFKYLLDEAQTQIGAVESGRFGADMQISLVNDGPVTFWLQS